MLERPKPEWLRIGDAFFGFDASRGGESFSFAEAFFMASLLPFHEESGRRLALRVDPSRQVIAIVDLGAGRETVAFDLDAVHRIHPAYGAFDMVAVEACRKIGVNDSVIADLLYIRDRLYANVQRALDKGFAKLFSRISSPTAPTFVEVPADVFRSFRMIDYRAGAAEALCADEKLFSLHIEPIHEGDARRSAKLGSKTALFARFLMGVHGGHWPESAEKSLLEEFSAWTVAQPEGRTSIGRSTLSDLKKRFPEGFNFQTCLVDKIGQ